MADKPSGKEVYNWEDTDRFELVHEALVGTWRHGTTHELVVRDKSTGKLWKIVFQRDKDNDYNSAREGEEEAYEVTAVTKTETVTTYERVREAS